MACAVMPGPVLGRPSCCIQCSMAAVLNGAILQGVPRFHFALGPTNYASFAAKGQTCFRQWPEGGSPGQSTLAFGHHPFPWRTALIPFSFPRLPHMPLSSEALPALIASLWGPHQRTSTLAGNVFSRHLSDLDLGWDSEEDKAASSNPCVYPR